MPASYFPLVSICIPAYNAEKYILQTLDSIYQQSYTNIEIIVVNDGSIDNTLKILLGQQKENLIIVNQENKGQCSAANQAFKVSKGSLIKFLDADDLISEDFIKNQVARLENNEDAIASSAWGRFYEDNLDTFNLNRESVWRDMEPMNWLVESLADGPNMMQCGLWLIPRKILSISGLWDERLSLINDFDFFIRVILSSKKILFTKDATLYYRSGVTDSLSAQVSRKALESALLSTKLGVGHILKFEDSVQTRKVCGNCLQGWKYIFYPREMDLYREANKIAANLGGSDYPFPAGGKTKLLSSIFGWKLTKRLKLYFNF